MKSFIFTARHCGSGKDITAGSLNTVMDPRVLKYREIASPAHGDYQILMDPTEWIYLPGHSLQFLRSKMDKFLFQSPISDQLMLSPFLLKDVNIPDINIPSFVIPHEKSSRRKCLCYESFDLFVLTNPTWRQYVLLRMHKH
jgi:hypothetical protein